MQVHVVKVTWQSHEPALQAIRNQVFVVEQEVAPEDEWDEQDKVADHFLALNEAGQALGCARLIASGQIGRMAVLEAYRGTGLGRQLLDAAVAEARNKGMDRVFLHAQTYVQDFYRKAGFVVNGPEFSEVNIPHVPMEQKLPLPFEAPAVDARPEVRPATPGQKRELTPSEPRSFNGMQDARSALLEMISSVNRQLFILNPHLDHEIFDHDELLQKISEFARSAPKSEVKILIMSSKLMVDRGHRLLDLARRIDGKIQIRLLDEEITETTSSFACGDYNCYWMMPVYDQYDGVVDLANPVTARRLHGTFTTAWDKSKEDPDLRVLRI